MKELENKLQYTFTNTSLLETALTHSSYANERRGGHMACNERLEFLGDSILGMIVARHLYETHPDMPEGKMTRLRAELVCEKSLFQMAGELNLGAYLRLGKGEEQCGGRQRPSINADAVEAVLAAVYLDGGMEAARGVMERCWPSPEDVERPTQDSKGALQELMQRGGGDPPEYRITGQSGPAHDPRSEATVYRNGKPLATGIGHTKKHAEQEAAVRALEILSKE